MKFSPTDVEIKITAKVVGQKTFKESTNSTLLDMEISIAGLVREKGNYVLVDYKASNHKYPFIYLNKADGKRYKTSYENAKRLFAA